jgi:hypothetical protein
MGRSFEKSRLQLFDELGDARNNIISSRLLSLMGVDRQRSAASPGTLGPAVGMAPMRFHASTAQRLSR